MIVVKLQKLFLRKYLLRCYHSCINTLWRKDPIINSLYFHLFLQLHFDNHQWGSGGKIFWGFILAIGDLGLLRDMVHFWSILSCSVIWSDLYFKRMILAVLKRIDRKTRVTEDLSEAISGIELSQNICEFMGTLETTCYCLHLECPPKSHVVKTWFSMHPCSEMKLWASYWSRRTLTSSVDSSILVDEQYE